MSYAIGADSALKGTESSEAQAVTSHSTTDHRDKDKASKATTHHGNAHDNRSLRWKEEDQTTGWGVTPKEYKGTKMKESGEKTSHYQGETSTPLGKGVQGVPNQDLHMPQ